jgi:beta-glucosidase
MMIWVPLSKPARAKSGGESETGEAPDPDFGEPGPLSGGDGVGGFRFGAASAATQIEDQNENTDWYWFTLPTAEGGMGEGTPVGEAARGYSMALEDVQLLSALHLDDYRFSISWSRIEPQRDVIEEDGLAHYDAFIDALVEAGIRPNVTLHHFSNPAWIDDPRDKDCPDGPSDANLCGFGHPEGGALVIEEARQHAALMAQRYGDRVDDWGTVNEPINYLMASHGVGVFPPGKLDIFNFADELIPTIRDYLLAHAAMYHAIKEFDTIDADGDGVAASVGLTLNVVQWVPARDNVLSENPDDIAARDRLNYAYAYLIPESIRGGSFDADLDGTPDEELPELEGTMDWLGVQYYIRAGVTAEPGLVPLLSATPCFDTLDLGACVPPLDPTFCVPDMNYEFNPDGLGEILLDFGDRWPDLPLIISESGIATKVGARRAETIVRTLEQAESAIDAGVDIRGYYHWSLFDNFEWAEGFSPRFGLYRVNYGDAYQRTPTLGADVLGEIVEYRHMSPDMRDSYGGSGPMTPEGEPGELCGGE